MKKSPYLGSPNPEPVPESGVAFTAGDKVRGRYEHKPIPHGKVSEVYRETLSSVFNGVEVEMVAVRWKSSRFGGGPRTEKILAQHLEFE